LPQGPGGVIFFSMPSEPASKRAIAFVDGQNLFYSARTTKTGSLIVSGTPRHLPAT
jgi:hypothetical protein